MKIKRIEKYRITDKKYMPPNVVEIRVEQDPDTESMVITYIYERDGQTRVERYSKEQMELHSAIWNLKRGDIE